MYPGVEVGIGADIGADHLPAQGIMDDQLGILAA